MQSHSSIETVLQGVTLGAGSQKLDLRIGQGRIQSVHPSQHTNGGLVLPLLADIHVHLDKTGISQRMPRAANGLFDAIALMQADMQNWSDADIQTRASWALETAYRNGICALRSHVDIPSPQKLPRAWHVLNELRQEWAGRIQLELSALIPLDFFDDDLAPLVAGIRRDSAVLGAFLYRNPDLEPKLKRCFDQAADNGLRLDFHVDEGLDIEADGLAAILNETRAHAMQGRVIAGHLCSLSICDPDVLARRIEGLVTEKIGVVSLPSTNLYLQDNHPGRTPRLRGIAPIAELRAAGGDVMLGLDNCRDPFFPYGNYDQIDTLRLGTLAAHLRPADWLDSICQTPKQWMGVEHNMLTQGSQADFIWFDAQSLDDLMSRPQTPRRVYRAGIEI